jgi:UDP-N-acetylmuramoyl-L-alanyl-D-glutamate--2,6-diaminopimelate ligase
MMPLQSVNGCALEWLLAKEDVAASIPAMEITGLCMDSRQVVPGDLFLACAGGNAHGLEFLSQAHAQGAIAALAEVTPDWLPEKIVRLGREASIPVIPVAELSARASYIAGRFYGHPSRSLSVIGITGTNGKTSCSHFIARAFAHAGRVGVMGTLGNGYVDELKPSTHTTMDPVSVQAHLNLFAGQGANMVAMEVSSHALQQGRVASVNFDMAVLTNFTRDHLDYHGSMAEYARAKSLLFKMPGLKTAIVNIDDELGKRLADDLKRSAVRVIAYGADFDASAYPLAIKATAIQPMSGSLSVKIASTWGVSELQLPVLGRFNAYNAMVALAVLLEKNVAFEQAIQHLCGIQNVRGRMQMLRAVKGPLVVIDFAHTPDALEQALTSIREHNKGSLTCVFGCGGNRDKGKRPLMGRMAERLADRVIVTDDNPRKEKAEDIISEILAGMQNPQQVVIEPDRAKAIAMAISQSSADDIVLIAGKGHETYQIYGDMKQPFSDESVAQQNLEAL